MKIKSFFSLKNIKTILTVVCFICCCLFAQDFYKITLGFIANNSRDPLLILTMTVAYVFPVICFLFAFCNYYIKKFHRVISLVLSSITIVVSVGVLINIFQNIETYVSNNLLGVYQTLPSIIVHFPFDGIIVYALLISLQVLNIIAAIKVDGKIAKVKDELCEVSKLDIKILEYLPYAILCILSCLFAGLFVCGLSALSNILYDVKYIYLLLWYLLPCITLICLVFKFENKMKTKTIKVSYLVILISVNAIFALLYFIFEKFDPDFVVRIGKPLLPITFSISQRIEFLILIVTQSIGSLICLIKAVVILLKKPQTEVK